MAIIESTHANRYWEVDETRGTLIGKLRFTQYYEDEVIVTFAQDKEDEETFWYASEFLEVEDDYITADNPDEAMERFEEMIIEHIEDEINGLEEMMEKFEEVAI